jgi:hypothetical protein
MIYRFKINDMEYTRKQIRKAVEAWARDAWDDTENEDEYDDINDYDNEEEYVKDCVNSMFYHLDD